MIKFISILILALGFSFPAYCKMPSYITVKGKVTHSKKGVVFLKNGKKRIKVPKSAFKKQKPRPGKHIIVRVPAGQFMKLN